jgi:hypothetical protein
MSLAAIKVRQRGIARAGRAQAIKSQVVQVATHGFDAFPDQGHQSAAQSTKLRVTRAFDPGYPRYEVARRRRAETGN